MSHKNIVENVIQKIAGTPWPVRYEDLGPTSSKDLVQILDVLNITWSPKSVAILDDGHVSITTRTFYLPDEGFSFLSKKISSLSYSDGMVEFVLKNKFLHE